MLKSVSYRWTRTGTQIRKCVERKLFLPRSPRKMKKRKRKKKSTSLFRLARACLACAVEGR